MDNNVSPPPLSIRHPIFSDRGPLYLPPKAAVLSPDAPDAERQGSFGFRHLLSRPGGSACLLPHKSPHPSPRSAWLPLTPPPAQADHVPERIATDDGFLVDLTSGEILSPVLDHREILHIRGCETDHSYWLQVYHNDLKVKKAFLQAPPKDRPVRGNIFEFSDDSRRRLLFVCRNSGHNITSQFCCTFHNSWPLDGKSLKKMNEAFIKRLKRRFGNDIHYLWVLEFQDRAAPHIHFYCDIDPSPLNRGLLTKAWLEVSGQENDIDCYEVHDHPKNFFTWEMKSGAYLAKEYIGKIEQKEVPAAFHNVGRFWGNSLNMTPDYVTIAPEDYDQALQDLHREAVRIVTKCAERKRDHFKTFGVIFSERLGLLGIPREEIPGKIKKQLSIGIKLSGIHRTHRRRPPTNHRRKRQSYNLANMAPTFYNVLNRLMSSPPKNGFFLFSSWAAAQKATEDCLRLSNPTPPPARQQPTPF